MHILYIRNGVYIQEVSFSEFTHISIHLKWITSWTKIKCTCQVFQSVWPEQCFKDVDPLKYVWERVWWSSQLLAVGQGTSVWAIAYNITAPWPMLVFCKARSNFQQFTATDVSVDLFAWGSRTSFLFFLCWQEKVHALTVMRSRRKNPEDEGRERLVVIVVAVEMTSGGWPNHSQPLCIKHALSELHRPDD